MNKHMPLAPLALPWQHNQIIRPDKCGLAYFFGAQVHSCAGLLHPEHTLFFIGLPHLAHGEHPHA
jgi:hypothetical protein